VGFFGRRDGAAGGRGGWQSGRQSPPRSQPPSSDYAAGRRENKLLCNIGGTVEPGGRLAVLDGTEPAAAEAMWLPPRRARSPPLQPRAVSGKQSLLAPGLTSNRPPPLDGKLNTAHRRNEVYAHMRRPDKGTETSSRSWRRQCEQASRRCDSWNCCSTNSETLLHYLHAPGMILPAQFSARNCSEKNVVLFLGGPASNPLPCLRPFLVHDLQLGVREGSRQRHRARPPVGPCSSAIRPRGRLAPRRELGPFVGLLVPWASLVRQAPPDFGGDIRPGFP